MKLTILGSGGSAVSAKRACPSLVVDDSLLFDLGPGSLKNLRVSHLDPERLTSVFISHTHADHISDLVPFLWAIQIDGRQTPLQIYGPPNFRSTLQKLFECTNTPSDFFKFPLGVTELEFGQKVGKVSTCRTAHSVPTLAFRVDSEGKSLCYTADTPYCPAVVELARDVDLLLHEATFLEDQSSIAELTTHSTARMAGRAGNESGAKALLLFHIPPPNDGREKEFQTEASAEYRKEVTLGSDLFSAEI
jgi:ribonuclease BN (tRNA processing enzyme)